MAIYYEPDELPADSPGLGWRVTRQGDNTTGDGRSWSPDMGWRQKKQAETPSQRGCSVEVTSRAQLIERIKRGESLTWVPNPALEILLAKYNALEQGDQHQRFSQAETPPLDPGSGETVAPQREKPAGLSCGVEPREIALPRSALHTGDFFEKSPSTSVSQAPSMPPAHPSSPPRDFLSASPTTPWYAPAVPSFPPRSVESGGQHWSRTANSRSRAPSLGSSLSSSFAFRPPTSPLAHAACNPDLDFSTNVNVAHQSSTLERGNRRRTLPPNSFHAFHTAISNAPGAGTDFNRPFPPIRRESSLPYQAHQPRRSLNSISMSHSMSHPQTPSLPRSRRPSLSSEHSPLSHASMVGSFEESILRGRMSTAPSKPLDFVAQIGVLGRGDCKPNLRCPAHVTVPFPAVFYKYPSIGTRSFSDDNPSPYVGTIDLEHSLKPIEAKRVRRRPASPAQSVDAHMKDVTAPENTHIGLAIDRKKRERQRKRSMSPKGPIGGCYRVPQQGQLQIVIKNPNKTAVKLYLVPYSLDGMEPGTKTFIRQRSFSAGPIMEKPLTDNPQLTLLDPLQNKSILRYLIHLKFCCPSKGRYYLYDNIRVVFANRVPDGKENLRNEVQLPQPRYSCYRPCREASMGSAGAKLAAEKASRRGSSGLGLLSAGADTMDGLTFTGHAATLPMNKARPASSATMPFHLPPRLKNPVQTAGPGTEREGLPNDANTGCDIEGHDSRPTNVVPSMDPGLAQRYECTTSPTPGFVPSTSARASPVSWASLSFAGNGFSSPSLSRAVSPPPVESGEGLLSRELRSLDVQTMRNTRDSGE